MNIRTILLALNQNGMIDTKANHLPDFDSMLKTCRRQVTDTKRNLIFNKFTEMYNKVTTKGHISDDAFNRLSHPNDKDGTGNHYIRHVKISDEKCQRAKILNRAHQMFLHNWVTDRRRNNI